MAFVGVRTFGVRRRQGRFLIGCGNLRNRLFRRYNLIPSPVRLRTLPSLSKYIIPYCLYYTHSKDSCKGAEPSALRYGGSTSSSTAGVPACQWNIDPKTILVQPGSRQSSAAEENITTKNTKNTKNTKKQSASALRRKLPKIFELGNPTDPLDRGCVSRQ